MSFEQIRNNYRVGKIHFIGIGGIGMSAIALILKKIGCQIQGSDLSRNNNINTLESQNIKCFLGHKRENISDDVILIVKTSIVKDDNPEILEAKTKNVPIVRRADILAEIMREKLGITVAGTHGKTSTTAMIAVLLDVVGFDPIVINGGVINYFASNAKFGEGKFLVAEGDESDASFVDLPSFVGVVNNIEPEHMDFYGGNFELVKDYYKKYITQIPQNGLAALGIDDFEVKQLYNQLIRTNTNIVSFSIKDKNADFFGFDISCDIKGVKFSVKVKKTGEIIKDIGMSIYGIYNIKNALGAIAVGNFLGFDKDQIKQGLEKYSGVKRRFSKVGEVGGIVIIDDYAHHPTEIKAVLKAAKQVVNNNNKLIAVFQPHKYSRLQDLFVKFCKSFSDADVVVVADIYSAGQDLIVGASQDDLIKGIEGTGHTNVIKLIKDDYLPKIIKEHAKYGDMVICIGAGSISNWANNLPSKLSNK